MEDPVSVGVRAVNEDDLRVGKGGIPLPPPERSCRRITTRSVMMRRSVRVQQYASLCSHSSPGLDVDEDIEEADVVVDCIVSVTCGPTDTENYVLVGLVRTATRQVFDSRHAELVRSRVHRTRERSPIGQGLGRAVFTITDRGGV